MTTSSILDELLWRDLIAQSTDLGALQAAADAGPMTLYCGFDPTAPSLHLGNLASFTRLWVLQRKQLAEASVRSRSRFDIRASSLRQPIGTLSGGNQQKVAFARLLHSDCKLLILDEPTRGVDVGSKAEIYRLIDEAAKNGAAVLLASSYLPELLGVCDRIGVMNRGRLVGIFDAKSTTSEELVAECVR